MWSQLPNGCGHLQATLNEWSSGAQCVRAAIGLLDRPDRRSVLGSLVIAAKVGHVCRVSVSSLQATLAESSPSTRCFAEKCRRVGRYHFESIPAGTRVMDSYEVLVMPRWVRTLRRIPGISGKSRREARRGMQVMLNRLKETAERNP